MSESFKLENDGSGENWSVTLKITGLSHSRQHLLMNALDDFTDQFCGENAGQVETDSQVDVPIADFLRGFYLANGGNEGGGYYRNGTWQVTTGYDFDVVSFWYGETCLGSLIIHHKTGQIQSQLPEM